MSNSTDTAQLPIPFEFNGQPYPLAACSYEVELLYTNWLEMRAYDKIARRREQFGPDYQRLLEIWKANVDADLYEWGGEIAFKSRWSEAGRKYLCYLLMSKVTTAVTPHLVDAIWRDRVKQQELLAALDRALAAGRPPEPVPLSQATDPVSSTPAASSADPASVAP